jgi:hypothetical protein
VVRRDAGHSDELQHRVVDCLAPHPLSGAMHCDCFVRAFLSDRVIYYLPTVCKSSDVATFMWPFVL